MVYLFSGRISRWRYAGPAMLAALLMISPLLPAQNVGIGTNTPSSKLSVLGNVGIGAGYTDTVGPANGAIIRGRVGIATKQPNTSLDVNGAITIRPLSTVTTLTTATTAASPATITVGDASYIQVSSDGTDPAQRVFTLSAGLQAGQHLFIENKTPAYTARMLTGGNIQLTNDTLTLGKSYGITATHMLWTGTRWIDIGNNTNKTPPPVATCAAEPATKVTFNYTGSAQSWTVPTGVTMIKVRLWAGGGGGGNNGGGGAGFVSGYMSVTPGQIYSVIVGQGGSKNATTVYGGGGKGNSTLGQSGGGGGRSALQLSGADVVTAGGGGGGGTSSFGGGGGDTVGMDGALASGCGNEFGKGGTQTAGGAGGVSCGSAAYSGLAGTQYTGGNASATYATGVRGGGGGAGYYGGGAGGANGGSGGAGGSSYIAQLINDSCFTYKNLRGTVGATSSSAAPGGATETDYVSGTGVGWGGGVAGANGLVLIYY